MNQQQHFEKGAYKIIATQYKSSVDDLIKTLISASSGSEIHVLESTIMGLIQLLAQAIPRDWQADHEAVLVSPLEIREKMMLHPDQTKIIVMPLLQSKEKQLLKQLNKINKSARNIFVIGIFVDIQIKQSFKTHPLQNIHLQYLIEASNLTSSLVFLPIPQLMQSQANQLIHSHIFNQKLISVIGSVLKIDYQPIQQSQLYSLYRKCLQNQEEKQTESINQKMVLPQRHENLCGYHSFHNIKQQTDINELLSEQKFLKNYAEFNRIINQGRRYSEIIKIPLFEPLEREQVDLLIKSPIFSHQIICKFFLSENYILNPPQQLKHLQDKVTRVRQGQLQQIFIIMGVFNHYFVLKLHDKTKILFMDSNNSNLHAILNNIALTTTQNRLQLTNMKTGIESIMNMFIHQDDIRVILCKLRINEVIGSYCSLADTPDAKKSWLSEEYPVAVIKNDLISEIKTLTKSQLGQQYSVKVKNWLDDDFVKEKILSKEERDDIEKMMKL